jgi:hypothetical protein
MPTMKNPLLGLCLILACSSSVAAQSWRINRAKLCFVRYEDNGAMNILESWIRVADYAVPVIGDQAVCLYVEPGSNELIVTSTVPYDPDSTDAQACKSMPLKLELTPDENRTFTIEPATKGSSYICGWLIEPTPSSHRTTPRKTHHP